MDTPMAIHLTDKEWDAARLEQLYHRSLPDMERLSLYYLNERLRWNPAKGASE